MVVPVNELASHCYGMDVMYRLTRNVVIRMQGRSMLTSQKGVARGGTTPHNTYENVRCVSKYIQATWIAGFSIERIMHGLNPPEYDNSHTVS